MSVDEERDRFVASTRNLLPQAVRDQLEEEEEEEERRRQEESSESESEDESTLDEPKKELLGHVQSFKLEEREASILNKKKREDKNSIREVLEGKQIDQLKVGKYKITLKKKPLTSISLTRLRSIGLSDQVLDKISQYMEDHPTNQLVVSGRRKSKKSKK